MKFSRLKGSNSFATTISKNEDFWSLGRYHSWIVLLSFQEQGLIEVLKLKDEFSRQALSSGLVPLFLEHTETFKLVKEIMPWQSNVFNSQLNGFFQEANSVAPRSICLILDIKREIRAILSYPTFNESNFEDILSVYDTIHHCETPCKGTTQKTVIGPFTS